MLNSGHSVWDTDDKYTIRIINKEREIKTKQKQVAEIRPANETAADKNPEQEGEYNRQPSEVALQMCY